MWNLGQEPALNETGMGICLKCGCWCAYSCEYGNAPHWVLCLVPPGEKRHFTPPQGQLWHIRPGKGISISRKGVVSGGEVRNHFSRKRSIVTGSRAKMAEMWDVNPSKSPDKPQTKVKLQSWCGSTACKCCLRHVHKDESWPRRLRVDPQLISLWGKGERRRI